MEKLTHLNNNMLASVIGEKLAKLTSGKISYDEALQEVNAIENLYEQMYGDRAGWSDALKKSINGIRSSIIEFYSKNGLGIGFSK